MENMLGLDLAYRVRIIEVQHQLAQHLAAQQVAAALATPPVRARLAQALVALAARLDPATIPAPYRRHPGAALPDRGAWVLALAPRHDRGTPLARHGGSR